MIRFRNINIKRVVIGWIAMNVAGSILPLLAVSFSNWIFQLEPQNIWKWKPDLTMTMSVSWYIWLFGGYLFFSLAIVLIYALLYNGIPGIRVKKGLCYGLLLWIIGVLLPNWSFYLLFKVASRVLIWWTIEALFECLIYGILLGIIYKPSGTQ